MDGYDFSAKEITRIFMITLASLKMLLKESKEKVFGEVLHSLESTRPTRNGEFSLVIILYCYYYCACFNAT